jgi:hypothetical protein
MTRESDNRHQLRSMAPASQEATHSQRAPPAQCHPGMVGRDRRQPRTEPGRVRQPRQAEECMDGGLLSDLLCLVARTDHRRHRHVVDGTGPRWLRCGVQVLIKSTDDRQNVTTTQTGE